MGARSTSILGAKSQVVARQTQPLASSILWVHKAPLCVQRKPSAHSRRPHRRDALQPPGEAQRLARR